MGGRSSHPIKYREPCTTDDNSNCGADGWACAITKAPEQGRIHCWGANTYGQAGNVSEGKSYGEVFARKGHEGERFFQIVAAKHAACGIHAPVGETTAGGSVTCWGAWVDGVSILGTKDGYRPHDYSPYPWPMPVLDGTKYIDIAMSDNQACGVTTAYKLHCWMLGPKDALGVKHADFYCCKDINKDFLQERLDILANQGVSEFREVAIVNKLLVATSVMNHVVVIFKDDQQGKPKGDPQDPYRVMKSPAGADFYLKNLTGITVKGRDICGIEMETSVAICGKIHERFDRGTDAEITKPFGDTAVVALRHQFKENDIVGQICAITKAGVLRCEKPIPEEQSVSKPGKEWSLAQVSSCASTTPGFLKLPAELSCLSCPAGLHHTVMNPAFRSGSCTSKPCPACKPRSCCGPHHKHFVLNSKSLEGVCIRHDNDCTPHCVRSDDRIVCTKGCNLPIRTDSGGKHTRSPKIVACQLEKRVLCEASSTSKDAHGNSVEKTKCTESKWVYAKAKCDYSPEMWRQGASCMVNFVLKMSKADGVPPVPTVCNMTATAYGCSRVTDEDHAACKPLATTY